jgi:hypothetical protein
LGLVGPRQGTFGAVQVKIWPFTKLLAVVGEQLGIGTHPPKIPQGYRVKNLLSVQVAQNLSGQPHEVLRMYHVWLKVVADLLKGVQQRAILQSGKQAVGGLETAVPRRPNRNPILVTLAEACPLGTAAVKHGYLVPLLLQGAGEPNGIQFCAAHMVWGVLVNQVKNTHRIVQLGMVC